MELPPPLSLDGPPETALESPKAPSEDKDFEFKKLKARWEAVTTNGTSRTPALSSTVSKPATTNPPRRMVKAARARTTASSSAPSLADSMPLGPHPASALGSNSSSSERLAAHGSSGSGNDAAAVCSAAAGDSNGSSGNGSSSSIQPASPKQPSTSDATSALAAEGLVSHPLNSSAFNTESEGSGSSTPISPTGRSDFLTQLPRCFKQLSRATSPTGTGMKKSSFLGARSASTGGSSMTRGFGSSRSLLSSRSGRRSSTSDLPIHAASAGRSSMARSLSSSRSVRGSSTSDLLMRAASAGDSSMARGFGSTSGRRRSASDLLTRTASAGAIKCGSSPTSIDQSSDGTSAAAPAGSNSSNSSNSSTLAAGPALKGNSNSSISGSLASLILSAASSTAGRSRSFKPPRRMTLASRGTTASTTRRLRTCSSLVRDHASALDTSGSSSTEAVAANICQIPAACPTSTGGSKDDNRQVGLISHVSLGSSNGGGIAARISSSSSGSSSSSELSSRRCSSSRVSSGSSSSSADASRGEPRDLSACIMPEQTVTDHSNTSTEPESVAVQSPCAPTAALPSNNSTSSSSSSSSSSAGTQSDMTGAQLDAVTAQLSVLASFVEHTEGLAAQAEAAAAAERAQNALTLQQLAEAQSGQAEAVLGAEQQAAELQDLQVSHQALGHTLIETEAQITALESQNLHLTQQAARQVLEVNMLQAELQESNGRIISLKRQLTAMNRARPVVVSKNHNTDDDPDVILQDGDYFESALENTFKVVLDSSSSGSSSSSSSSNVDGSSSSSSSRISGAAQNAPSAVKAVTPCAKPLSSGATSCSQLARQAASVTAAASSTTSAKAGKTICSKAGSSSSSSSVSSSRCSKERTSSKKQGRRAPKPKAGLFSQLSSTAVRAVGNGAVVLLVATFLFCFGIAINNSISVISSSSSMPARSVAGGSSGSVMVSAPMQRKAGRAGQSAFWSTLLPQCQAGDPSSSEFTCRLHPSSDSAILWWWQPAASAKAPQSACWAVLLPQSQAGDSSAMSCALPAAADPIPWWQQPVVVTPSRGLQSACWAVLLPQSQAGDDSAMSCAVPNGALAWWQVPSAAPEEAPTCSSLLLEALKTEAVAAYSWLHARTLPLAKDTVQFAWLMTMSATLSALKRGL